MYLYEYLRIFPSLLYQTINIALSVFLGLVSRHSPMPYHIYTNIPLSKLPAGSRWKYICARPLDDMNEFLIVLFGGGIT